jgi:hypothetical protein
MRKLMVENSSLNEPLLLQVARGKTAGELPKRQRWHPYYLQSPTNIKGAQKKG